MRRPNPPVPPVTIATDPLRSTDPPRPRRWAREASEAPVRNPSVLGDPAPQRREQHPGHQREQEEHRVRHESVHSVHHTSPPRSGVVPFHIRPEPLAWAILPSKDSGASTASAGLDRPEETRGSIRIVRRVHPPLSIVRGEARGPGPPSRPPVADRLDL